MRLKLYIKESTESGRLTHEIQDLKQRWFVYSYLKNTEKNWLDTGPVLAVETTIDINTTEKSIYLNRQDAKRRGKGYGLETMEFILKLAKKKGFKTAKGYVEHINAAPLSMLKKLGFKETENTVSGRYFYKKL